MKQQGFSLTELSIVLVIIGLLLTGIMNSQGLVVGAKANDVISIIDDLRAATTYFKQRYNYLPGDWIYTANEIPNVTNLMAPGNGDGSINPFGDISAQSQVPATSEMAAAPFQLFSAGLLGKLNNGGIATSYGPVYLVSGATANALIPNFSAANPAVRNAIVFANLPCDVVGQVDYKIDDGTTDYVSSGANGRAFGTACTNTVVQWYAVAL